MKHKATIAIALCTIAAMPTLSQTIPYAEFVNADTTVCDVISLNIPVRCKVNGTEMFSLRYNCPSQGDKLDRKLTLEEGNAIYYIPINIDDNGSAVWSQDHTETIRLISISTESGGGFSQPVPLQSHAVDTAHHIGSLGIDHPKAGIVRVFDVAIGWR